MRLSLFLIFSLLINNALTAVALEFDPKHLFQSTAKAVVLIAAFDPGQKNQNLGTGSIISPDGLILTNAHVLFNDQDNRPYINLRVYLKPKYITGDIRKDTIRKYKVVLIKYSNSLDLAVLKIQGGDLPFPHLQFADSNQIEIGEPVLAIGHPEQGGLWTLTTGTISSQMESFQDILGKNVFQTETSINKGNSGGPLINKYSLIVGINSNIARKGKNGLVITDINFSIKSNVVLRWLNTIGYSFSFSHPQVVKKNLLTPKTAGIIPNEEQKNLKLFSSNSKYSPLKLKLFTKPSLKQIEREMEDMMEEMRKKIQIKRSGTKTR